MSNSSAIHKELFWTLCHEQIGYGTARQVFSSLVLPDCVIKVEDVSGSFQNIVEWETWKEVKQTPHAKWFAPCKWISPSGNVLIMAKTLPGRKKEYPTKMPSFLTDFKRTNYGMLDGRMVCHDYGTNDLMMLGLVCSMKKTEWWDLENL